LIKGYLKKTNKYPVCFQENQSQHIYSKKWLTGFYNYDKICSSLGLYFSFHVPKKNIFVNIKLNSKGYSIKTIEDKLDLDPSVLIIVK
jgi:hypothetical protein